MELIQTALFESPGGVYLALAVGILVMGGIWYERRSHAMVTGIVAAVVLAGLVFVVETMVVTDREKIIASLHAMAAEVQGPGQGGQNLRAVRLAMDDAVIVDLPEQFGKMNMNKAQALAAGQAFLAGRGLRRVKITKLAITVDGRRATSEFTMIVRYNSGDLGIRPVAAIWKVYWIKRDVGWRIIRVTEPRIPSEPWAANSSSDTF